MGFTTLLLLSTLIFSGCSSINYELHESPSSKNLNDIELKKGERVLVIEQTSRFMVGIYPGVVALNPDIVKVENIVEGSTTYVYIQGRNIGETSLEYTAVRRNTEGYGKEEAPDLGECRQCFKVKVIK